MRDHAGRMLHPDYEVWRRVLESATMRSKEFEMVQMGSEGYSRWVTFESRESEGRVKREFLNSERVAEY